MAKKYCVLWIPSLYYVDTHDVIDGKEKEKNISDEKGEEHHVKISLQENKNIIVKNDAFQMELRYERHCKNGLYFYSYEIEGDDEHFLSRVPNAIYHTIKEFYHTHEHHAKDADSLLTALVSENKIEDNEAINHYLSIYKQKFIAYSQIANKLFDKLEENSEKKSSKFKLLSDYKKFTSFCHCALGEYLYCNTLLKSTDDSELIFNIKNTVDNIKFIENKSQTEFSRRSTKIGFTIASIGIILAVLGVILTIRSFKTPDYIGELEELQNKIYFCVDTIRSEQNRIDAKIDTTALQLLDKVEEIINKAELKK